MIKWIKRQWRKYVAHQKLLDWNSGYAWAKGAHENGTSLMELGRWVDLASDFNSYTEFDAGIESYIRSQGRAAWPYGEDRV